MMLGTAGYQTESGFLDSGRETARFMRLLTQDQAGQELVHRTVWIDKGELWVLFGTLLIL